MGVGPWQHLEDGMKNLSVDPHFPAGMGPERKGQRAEWVDLGPSEGYLTSVNFKDNRNAIFSLVSSL